MIAPVRGEWWRWLGVVAGEGAMFLKRTSVCESRWGRHFDRMQVGAGPVHAAVADSPHARPRRPVCEARGPT